MTFYLKPVEGTISTSLFQSYAECRLKYLITLRPNDTADRPGASSCLPYADCLVEGSAKDRVSHFALRSTAILDSKLHSFVLHKEQLLFRKRFEKMKYEELKSAIVIVLKQLKEYKNCSCERKDAEYFRQIEKILIQVLQKRLLKHAPFWKIETRARSFTYCPYHQSSLILSVPFNHVLPFVARREVIIKNGEAQLRCDQVPLYLSFLFKLLLDINTQKIENTSCLEKLQGDSRILELLVPLKKIFSLAVPLHDIPVGNTNVRLTLETLDKISQQFPPCMRALHQTLRSRHRLCHRPRVQYTLFLKEVGLPINDCLQLIQSEYSRPAVQTDYNQKHKCEHSWHQDSKRYTYGTRHLYGLEGCKKDYSSHSCFTIQREAPGPNECGGCPFVHYDQENLKRFLIDDLNGKENAERYLAEMKSQKIFPIESCHLHLRFKSNQLSTSFQSQELRVFEHSQVKMHAVFKPKHYFSVMSNLSQ